MSLGTIFSGVGRVIAAAEEFELGVFDTFFSIKDDVEAFAHNLEQLKSFDFDPKWKTRVISLPAAKDAIMELIDEVTHGLADNVKELIAAMRELEDLIKGSAPPDEQGGGAVADFLSRLASIKLGLQRLKAAFHALLNLETTVTSIKTKLETLDSLFLPQGSTKTRVEVTYRKRGA